MPPRRKPRETSRRLARSLSPTRYSQRLRNKMVGSSSGSRGRAVSVISGTEQLRLRATWTQGDVEMLLDYVEDNRYKAGDRMVFQEGHFNALLPLLPDQANGHRKTAKNCHDKWESLKREYYTASAMAGGSGLAYSAERGANIITEAGQLVMDDLVEVHPVSYINTIHSKLSTRLVRK
ncbi:hypothetical protein EDD15DRAFT_2376979 [Pisolithus albus]|nr:hypothetical protein EDD15DRAFT_2376979 [Pisolithus albus]